MQARLATFALLVEIVVRNGAEKQMRGVAAAWVIAGVANECATWIDAGSKCECNAVS